MTMVVNNSLGGSGSGFRGLYDTDEKLAAVTLFGDYSEPLLYFAFACFVIFMLIGIPGNLTTIIALARYKKARNATAIFIINLHISDFIFCCVIIPMTAITFAQRRWTHGVIMCRVFPFVKYTLSTCSILTILNISINRYVLVCHPLLYPRIYKRRNVTIMLILLWTVSVAIFMATILGAWGVLDLDPNGGLCTMLKDKHDRSPKRVLISIAFMGPYLMIFFCYARIWWVVRTTEKKSKLQTARTTQLPVLYTKSDPSKDVKRLIGFESSISGTVSPEDNTGNDSAPNTPKGERNFEKYFKTPFRLTRKSIRPKAATRRDKKLCAMIATIMLSFCCTQLPIMFVRMVSKEYKSKPIPNVSAHLLEYLGTCINPIIYVLMSKEYRQAYKSLLDSVKKKIQRE